MAQAETIVLVPLSEAAKRLGMTVKTLRNWSYLGKIEVVHVGRQVKVKEQTIQSIIERGTTPAREEYRW